MNKKGYTLAETKGIKPRTLIREILEEYVGD